MNKHWEAQWECFWMVFHRQNRKLTIRNIIKWGFSARDAIEMVRACEVEG